MDMGGINLSQLKQNGCSFDSWLVSLILCQCINALKTIHELKYTRAHCDIKPENMLGKNNDMNLFLIDFGLAKCFVEKNGQ